MSTPVVLFLHGVCESWFKTTDIFGAPINDLWLLENIEKFAAFNPKMSLGNRHLWYLSEKMLVLSLYSLGVSREEKVRMAVAMWIRDDGVVREVRHPPFTTAIDPSLDRLFMKAAGQFFRNIDLWINL